MAWGVEQIDGLSFRLELGVGDVDRHSAASLVLRLVQNPGVGERRLPSLFTVLGGEREYIEGLGGEELYLQDAKYLICMLLSLEDDLSSITRNYSTHQSM